VFRFNMVHIAAAFSDCSACGLIAVTTAVATNGSTFANGSPQVMPFLNRFLEVPAYSMNRMREHDPRA